MAEKEEAAFVEALSQLVQVLLYAGLHLCPLLRAHVRRRNCECVRVCMRVCVSVTHESHLRMLCMDTYQHAHAGVRFCAWRGRH